MILLSVFNTVTILFLWLWLEVGRRRYNRLTEQRNTLAQANAADLKKVSAELNHHDRVLFRLKDQLRTASLGIGHLWATGNGTVLRIRDMTDLHLENAIAWLDQQPALTETQHTQRRAIREEQRRRRYGRKLEEATFSALFFEPCETHESDPTPAKPKDFAGRDQVEVGTIYQGEAEDLRCVITNVSRVMGEPRYIVFRYLTTQKTEDGQEMPTEFGWDYEHWLNVTSWRRVS